MLHSPPPLIALSSVLTKLNKMLNWYRLSVSWLEQKWMCQSHGIPQLPHSLFRSVVLPLHLYLSYGSVLENCDLHVEDTHWLNLELSLEFHLNHIPIYHMVRIMYIFLKQRNMKNIMSSSTSRQCNWPYSFKHFKHPIISSNSLAQLPSFNKLLFAFTLR